MPAAQSGNGGNGGNGGSGGTNPTPTQSTDLVTYKNDLARSGQNLTESVLTLAKVGHRPRAVVRGEDDQSVLPFAPHAPPVGVE